MDTTARLSISPKSTKDEVVTFLAGLPLENDRHFESALTHLILTDSTVLPILYDVMCDNLLALHVRYGAFFAVGTYARRRKDVSTLLKLLVVHEDEFREFGTYSHLYSMALRGRSGPGDAAASIERARVAKTRLPDHPGVLHAFAETAIAAFEEGDLLPDRAGLLIEAEDSLTRALNIESSYPKFYCTKGRLEALKGHYREARTLIRRAIDQENSSESDYWGRLADYQAHLLQVGMRETSHRALTEFDQKSRELRFELQKVSDETTKHVGSFNASLKEMQARHLEFLVFFTAILALIISSIQLANRPAMREVMATLIMLGGILIVSFAALGLLIRDKFRRSLLVLAIGVVMCATAIMLWHVI